MILWLRPVYYDTAQTSIYYDENYIFYENDCDVKLNYWQLGYYTKNFDTMPIIMEIWFNMENYDILTKTMKNYNLLYSFDL